MGSHISMCLYSSKANSSAKISDSSTWYPQAGQHISIQTFRELNQVPTSSPTSIRTETLSTGESFRSMEGLQEGVNNLQTMLTPQQLTQAVSQRLLEYLGN
uniref:C4 n=1 Tax=Tomato leaf curl Sudan virus TaxID=270146 RepID=I3QBA6_9GEMI|nr:C4 [Tomato leaf curl Sudan virus]AFI56582.1 C4 [Tomato leaf curl Sudan virus]AFI56583.1 C4 [Tomato leaf curl Sudan virus]AFI56584.1 C4 [Tomato leaf curl Sudan virus]AFI56585.1 C4 [Tomato leaf curl Sudan virus]